LDELLIRLRAASHVAANNEAQEVAMLLLDAALAIQTMLGAQHALVEFGKRAGTPTEGSA
jgi:hypothetical protein